MAKICADIKPTGINQKDLVDLIYDLTSSVKGICQKLDADGTTPATDFTATCFTAVFNCTITDSKANRIQNYLDETSSVYPHVVITPTGISVRDIIEWMYQFVYAMYLLSNKCDDEALTLNTYEATAYTAVLTQRIVNSKGNSIGYSTDYTFGPTAALNNREFVDFLYKAVYSIYALTHDATTSGLDGDGTLTDTDYEALWYTANITLTVENSQGNRIGN